MELLIVIVILGLLAAIVVYAADGLSKASIRVTCQSDFKTVETAQEAFKGKTGAYATDLNQLHGTWLKELPGNTNLYTITIDNAGGNITAANYGAIQVAVLPAHAPVDGNGNCGFA
jgi:general secretion pathway protein G